MEEHTIHWSDLYGNPFKFNLHPLMLTEKGYRLKTVAPIKGRSKREKVPVTVIFDESYVVAIISKNLEQLQPEKYNDWQGIVSKAYAHWNDKKKQVQQ